MSTSEKSFDWGDWLERSLWTGLQSALAVIVVPDISSLSAAATAFAAAGISALKTLAKARLAR